MGQFSWLRNAKLYSVQTHTVAMSRNARKWSYVLTVCLGEVLFLTRSRVWLNRHVETVCQNQVGRIGSAGSGWQVF